MFKRALATGFLALGILLGIVEAGDQMGLGAGLFQVRAQDHFGRANAALTTPWTVTTTAVPTIVSNLVQSNTLNADASAFYSGTYSVNQYSQITVTAQATALCHNRARVLYTTSGGADTAYQLQTAGGLGASTLELDKVVAGVTTVLGSWSSTLALGDNISLSYVNGTLTAYHNSFVVGSVQDAAITTGSPGISVFVPTGGALTNCSLDDWVGGNVSIPAPAGGSPVFAAPTPVQSGWNFATSYNFAKANQANDLIVVAVGWSNTDTLNSVSDTKGNVYLPARAVDGVNPNGKQAMYYASNIVAAAAGANTIVLHFASGGTPTGLDIRVVEYSGVATNLPLDASIGAAAASGTAMNSGNAAATTQSTDLLVGAGYTQISVSAAGSGYTQRVFSGGSNTIQDKVVTSTGVYNSAETQASTGWWAEQMVAFKAAIISGGGSSSSSGGSGSSSGTDPLVYANSLRGTGQLMNGQVANLFGPTSAGPGFTTTYGGQFNQFLPSNNPTPANITINDFASGNTGLTPAIIHVFMALNQQTCAANVTMAQTTQAVTDLLLQNTFVMVSVVPRTPTVTSGCTSASDGSSFANILKSGGVCTQTACSNYFYGYGCVKASPCGGVWLLAQQFNTIRTNAPNKTIFYRPLDEGDLPNTNWFYGTNGTAGTNPTNAQYVLLFQQTEDELNADGVTNVDYGYNVNWFSGAYAQNDPGPSYRKWASIDFYCCALPGNVSPSVDTQSARASSMSGTGPTGGAGWWYVNSLGIPVFASEAGSSNSNNGSIVLHTYDLSLWGNVMQSNPNGSNLVGVQLFTQNWCDQCQNNALNLLNHSISRKDLPLLL